MSNRVNSDVGALACNILIFFTLILTHCSSNFIGIILNESYILLGLSSFHATPSKSKIIIFHQNENPCPNYLQFFRRVSHQSQVILTSSKNNEIWFKLYHCKTVTHGFVHKAIHIHLISSLDVSK